ncbi:hypothetical protein GVAV_002107 [Gurleya vavrai]
MMIENIVIIGNGPGAYVAGIYAATANLEPLIIEFESSESNNYSGVDKIGGVLNCKLPKEYTDLVREQAKRFNVRFETHKINEIYFGKNIKLIFKEKEIITKALIIDDLEIAKQVLHVDLFNEEGLVITEDKTSQSVIPGLFICGSAREINKEAILLSASGCMAALDAKNYIEENPDN